MYFFSPCFFPLLFFLWQRSLGSPRSGCQAVNCNITFHTILESYNFLCCWIKHGTEFDIIPRLSDCILPLQAIKEREKGETERLWHKNMFSPSTANAPNKAAHLAGQNQIRLTALWKGSLKGVWVCVIVLDGVWGNWFGWRRHLKTDPGACEWKLRIWRRIWVGKSEKLWPQDMT